MKSRGFFENTRRACSDEALADKLRAATDRQRAAREVMCEELADVDAFRTLAAHLRDEVLCNLDGHLRRFVQGLEESGVHVHWATDGEEACSIIARVAKDHDVRTIVKSKSMITEEIGLNPALEAEGMEVRDITELVADAI